MSMPAEKRDGSKRSCRVRWGVVTHDDNNDELSLWFR